MPDVTDGLEVVVACSSHSPGVAVERQTASSTTPRTFISSETARSTPATDTEDTVDVAACSWVVVLSLGGPIILLEWVKLSTSNLVT